MFLTLCILGVLMALALGAAQTSFGEAGRIIGPSGPVVRRFSWIERALYIITLACAAVLAITGIGTYLFTWGEPMTGLILMLHASVAPPFVICVTLVALIWADRCQFAQEIDSGFGLLNKLLFWAMAVLALIVILSAVFPMTPVFGTHGQELLDLTHKVSSIILTIVLILQAIVVFSRK